MESNTFNFLGDIILKEQLLDFAQIIREKFPIEPTHIRVSSYEFILNDRLHCTIRKTSLNWIVGIQLKSN